MKLTSLKPEDIKQSLLQHTLQRPLVLYPVVTASLALGYGLLIETSLVVWALSAVGAGIGATSWLTSYFVKGEDTALAAVDAYHADVVKQRLKSMDYLKQQLIEFDQQEGTHQIELLNNKFAAFQDVLNIKMNKGELTYIRYLTMAEQVYLSAIDNLNDAVSSLKSIAGIDMPLLEKQLSQLGDSEFDQDKAKALNNRKELYQSAHTHVDKLFLENEHAMTEIDRASNQLAKISTQSGHAVLDIEDAMTELRTMAQRAEKYNK